MLVPSEHVHESAGGGGVGTQRWRRHVASGVSPAVVEVVGAVRSQAGRRRLAEDDRAVLAVLGDRVGAPLRHDVQNVDGTVGGLAQNARSVGRFRFELQLCQSFQSRNQRRRNDRKRHTSSGLACKWPSGPVMPSDSICC